MKRISIVRMTNSHNDQLRALEFYKQEISFLKSRLTTIGSANTRKEIMKQLEHFENQFRIQTDNIDQLSHDIRHNISQIAVALQITQAGYVDEKLVSAHQKLSEDFGQLEKVINELRHEFDNFSSIWM